MNRGNVEKVRADAKKIAQRLRKTDVTLKKLMAEYHCSYTTMIKAVLSEIPRNEWLQIRKKRFLKGGIKTRFQKGCISWNKGLKGIHFSPATEFKKGHIPPAYKEVGTITIRQNHSGLFRMIKIAKHKWIPYARYLWEVEYGPVPDGYFVVHGDGNRLHDKLDNLRLVNCRANINLMRKNNPEWYKKVIRSRKKIIRARKKRKQEQFKMQQKIARQIQLEAGQKKAVELAMATFYGTQIIRWDCCSCAASYKEKPLRCIKCGGGSFEKIIIRRKMA